MGYRLTIIDSVLKVCVFQPYNHNAVERLTVDMAGVYSCESGQLSSSNGSGISCRVRWKLPGHKAN